MIQFEGHQEVLYELHTRLPILNKMLMSTIQTVLFLRYTVEVLTYIHTGVTHLTSGILSLKGNVGALYEYIRVLASHKVNPLTVPSVDLHNILVKVTHDIRTNPILELPDDSDRSNWIHFSIMKVIPVIMDDFLLMILSTTLIDKSLQMDLYKASNLPALHPDSHISWKNNIWQSVNINFMLLFQQNMILESTLLLKDTFACFTKLFVL